MYKILVSDKLSEQGLKVLKENKDFKVDVKTGLKPEELKSIIGDYDALLVRSSTKVTKEIIDASSLKIIGRAGVGLDNVDLEAATNKGIIVMNSPSGNTISTAEHTMALMLSLSRNIAAADKSMKAKEWNRSKFTGVELYNKTLGVVGLGRIGQAVSKRAMSFGMKIIAYDPFLSKEAAGKLGIELVDLNKLFSESDYITFHVPLTEETKNLISSKQIPLLKKGARIINCSRGGIVNEEDLAKALQEGKIAGVSLDVYTNEPPKDLPLANFDNVVLTPHLGASTEEAQVNVAVEIAEQVRDALLGLGIRNAANFPSVDTETYKALQPMFNLAEKMGLFMGQLAQGRISGVEVNYSGEVAKFDTTPLTMSVLKGLLTPVLKDTVNFINALSLAKERSIKVTEEKSSDAEDFTNLISLEVKTEESRFRVAGTLLTKKDPRIVKINDFYVEAIPDGHMLIIYDLDKPGIIGNLGTLLGKHDINIAGMTFGRLKKSGEAITVLNIDSQPSPKVLESIKKLKYIKEVKVIKL
ncbi:MAG: phosphoglycerate dehydrogenase [Candidatus Omnitrophica bacterium]|nr:phosphoglycerate dehydrogenase [Candidatus Omnitrophota bacterium]MDD5351853.1 phosphoglycerate dehydrogenase [Candidatus Omnitrophota bacterium]MDD5550679.1 phosphoglycerate dehydrogenase [Candidatus Omnitrophota bacterium]